MGVVDGWGGGGGMSSTLHTILFHVAYIKGVRVIIKWGFGNNQNLNWVIKL